MPFTMCFVFCKWKCREKVWLINWSELCQNQLKLSVLTDNKMVEITFSYILFRNLVWFDIKVIKVIKLTYEQEKLYGKVLNGK